MSSDALTPDPDALPWSNEQIELAASDLTYYRSLAIGDGTIELQWAESILAALQHERRRVEHIIEVLRDADRNNGGYGFVRDILRYLGADQEGQG